METDFIWTIFDCERRVSDGGIVVVHWICTAIDTPTGLKVDTVSLTELTPDSSSNSFIEFEDVIEDNIIRWVQEALEKDEIENELQARLNELKAPAQVSGLPWS